MILEKKIIGIFVQTMIPKGHFEINWPLAKAQKKGILALSLACLLEIDGEHLAWCSFYRRGARLLVVATVAPPSGGGRGLCLKDTTESETGILQAPTLPTPVNKY